MSNNRKEPDGIRRKRKRRAPMSLEEIERERNIRINDINENPRHKRRVSRKKLNKFNFRKFNLKKLLSIA